MVPSILHAFASRQRAGSKHPLHVCSRVLPVPCFLLAQWLQAPAGAGCRDGVSSAPSDSAVTLVSVLFCPVGSSSSSRLQDQIKPYFGLQMELGDVGAGNAGARFPLLDARQFGLVGQAILVWVSGHVTREIALQVSNWAAS